MDLGSLHGNYEGLSLLSVWGEVLLPIYLSYDCNAPVDFLIQFRYKIFTEN